MSEAEEGVARVDVGTGLGPVFLDAWPSRSEPLGLSVLAGRPPPCKRWFEIYFP